MVKYEYVWEMNEGDDPFIDAPDELVRFKTHVEVSFDFIEHPGKKYVKIIQICDHLDGNAGMAFKNGFAIAYLCKGYNSVGGPCLQTKQTKEGLKALETTIIHELGHVYDMNNPDETKGKYDTEEYARMQEPGNEHWKKEYDRWYSTLNEYQKGRLERNWYSSKRNAYKALKRYGLHPHLFVELNEPVTVPYGAYDNFKNQRVKEARYILYYIR